MDGLLVAGRRIRGRFALPSRALGKPRAMVMLPYYGRSFNTLKEQDAGAIISLSL